MAGKIRKLALLIKYMRDTKVSGWNKALFFLPLIYFISPIDLFPDLIFPFGYLEDMGVLLFGWQMILKELEKYRLKDQPKGQKPGKKGKVVELRKDDYTVE